MIWSPARLWYEVRWWRWFLFTGRWPVRTLYTGGYRLDRASRRLINERFEREKYAREPDFRGTYPNHNGRENKTDG